MLSAPLDSHCSNILAPAQHNISRSSGHALSRYLPLLQVGYSGIGYCQESAQYVELNLFLKRSENEIGE